MEMGLDHSIPTYSGGLGVLAGDSLKSAADLGLPVVGVTLLHKSGYFKQRLNEDGWQIQEYEAWDPSKFMEELPNRVTVKIEGRDVSVRAFRYEVKGIGGHVVPVYFLDTNGNGDEKHDDDITKEPLYSDGDYHRLCQEVVLGIGGVRMLQSLGYDIEKYHMNEGHSAFLALELLRQLGSVDKVKELTAFTTHTPVPAGHEHFDYTRVRQVTGDMLPSNINELAGEKDFSPTQLALNMSGYINAVSKKHGEVTRAMFPDYDIDAIANGVHSATWSSGPFRQLYDSEIPGWRANPSQLALVRYIDNRKLLTAHRRAKEALVEDIERQTGVKFDPERPIFGAARRMTSYKRMDLPFVDMERFYEILRKDGTQLIFAGKAHPNNDYGKAVIQNVYRNLAELRSRGINAAFKLNYGMKDCGVMTSGSDVWGFFPVVGQEASSTSGMCAAMNGVPQLGTPDGWWREGAIEGITGWTFGSEPSDTWHDAQDFYHKFEKVVLPAIADESAYARLMKGAISINGAHFNTHRMIHEYDERPWHAKVPEKVH